ncbi:hypothetical protein M408DRAFT_333134 [Serendipita vermifera MAFF 305830]|uniref:FCP1 homology domain-containing protein n=1 Tax=Serendipita vermifera MAFF 305830 TaxID=933852 RepID=A0A0C3ARX2_SERVB|nr:hypothetical protein M408DRAFT_333134 [Serendipita vermifera MAFF 305830]
MYTHSHKRSREDDNQQYNPVKRSRRGQEPEHDVEQAAIEARFSAWASSANRSLVQHEAPTNDEELELSLEDAWRSMKNGRFVDGPILPASTLPGPGLFQSKGQMYVHHLNASLPLDDLETVPSPEYVSTTLDSSQVHEARTVFGPANAAIDTQPSSSSSGLPPRHLVILDLNGSLLYRSEFRGQGTVRSVTRRPYVACLAKYLAHQRTRSAVIVEQKNSKKKVHHLLPPDFDVRWLDMPPEASTQGGKKNKRKKKKNKSNRDHQHPDSKVQSLIDLRRKIQAHPENFKLMCALDAMVWSSVWAHNLLSMVDAALGTEQGVLRACWTRGMLRLSNADFKVKVQTTKNLETVWWSSEETYSARSTVLIDDTVKKARLQPWNLLQIPEFSCAEQEQEEEEPDAASDVILLAVIGILEELRFQSNIPAWFRSGGLWSTGGAAPKERSHSPQVVQGGAAGEEEEALWSSDPDVLAYWVKRGRGALAGRGIRTEPGILAVDDDPSVKDLRH